MSKKLKITWTKSTINQKEEHCRTIKALGLKRLRHAIVKDDCPQLRGMLRRVDFLVTVEEVKA